MESENPEEADFILFPYYLQGLITKLDYNGITSYIKNLPLFNSFSHKHIFFRPDDNYNPLCIDSIVFKSSMNKCDTESAGIALPYFCENFENLLSFDESVFSHHINFVGFIGSSSVRLPVLKSFLSNKNLVCEITVFDKFFFHTDTDSQQKHRELFINALRKSFLTLCPAGTGKNSIRFFETLSMGRIPVLISDNCVLPFENEINYDDFIIRIDEKDAGVSSQIIEKWLTENSFEQIKEKCKKARSVWEEYFTYNNALWYIIKSLQNIKGRSSSSEQLSKKEFGFTDYIKMAEDAKSEAEYHIKNNRVLDAMDCLIKANMITGNQENVKKLVELKNTEMVKELRNFTG